MSEKASLWDIPSVTGSPALESGATLSGSPDGQMTEKSGPGVAPAQDSRARAKGEGLTTLVTSGLTGTPSSASAALQLSLESRLMTLLDSAGSTLFVETWKRRVTPLRRRYWEHTARAPLTSGSGCTSVPTPQAADMTGGGQAKRALRSHRENGVAQSANLNDYAMLASVPTPMAGSPATETYNAAGNNDYSRRIVELCGVPSPCTPNGGRSMSTEKMDSTGKTLDGKKHTASLEHVVKFSAVATPRSEDSQCAGAHRGNPDTLHAQANLASRSTPSSRDWKDSSGMSVTGVDPDGSTRSRLDQLPRQAQLAATGLIATGGTEETKSTGQLDPEYSRWLQGLPPVFCDCAVMAMQLLRPSRKRSSKRI